VAGAVKSHANQVRILAETITDVRASFQRATTLNGRFFQDFYATLLAKNPAYVRMFGNVEMVQQYARLYAGIMKLFEYAENPRPETLHLIAAIHNTKALSLEHSHYLDWLDSLLTVLSKSDDRFDVAMADKWLSVVMPGIEFMRSQRG
jgi:hypothetical protein